MTIIHIGKNSKNEYPYLKIDTFVIDYFNQIFESLPTFKLKQDFEIIKRILECVLQLTDRTLTTSIMRSGEFFVIYKLVLGAINSSKIFNFKQTRKYSLSKCFIEIVDIFVSDYQAYPIKPFKAKVKVTSDDLNTCAIEFDKHTLNEEKLWVWKGWGCKNLKNDTYWAPLYPLYEKLGKEFTSSIYRASAEYLGRGNDIRVPCLKPLVHFISTFPSEITSSSFEDPEFMGQFWRLFLIYYLKSGYNNGDGGSIQVLSEKWRNNFKFFVENYLVKPEIIAETWGEFPVPPILRHTWSKTNLKKNKSGEFEYTKLLTKIPLSVSDEEAIHLLFKQINADVQIAIDWATWAAKNIWDRFENKIQLSNEGEAVIDVYDAKSFQRNAWLRNRENPNHLNNAASTLIHHLHITNNEVSRLFLPSPLTQTAYELAMPVAGSLMPHCILLVAHHPEITTSFLESFMLYDKNGKLIGLSKQDGSYKLISHKYRKGALLAQQIISLNETTILIIEQLIALTSAIRQYLKSKNDDNWRYLLITCGKGFSYPNRINSLSSETSSELRKSQLANSLANTCDLNLDERHDYVSRFSLTSLRASSGVLVYLKTRSLKEMSKALGHTQFDGKLIHRYLPEPILVYFQERWIRIFQSAILVESLQDSEYLLEASGFSNIDDLNEFLNNHALKIPPISRTTEVDQSKEINGELGLEVIFGVNTMILTLLISLQLAVKTTSKSVHAKAIYWAELTPHLITHIEANESHRPDLYGFLESAKRNANPALMEEIIYA